MENTIKVFELAKEYDMTHIQLIPLLQEIGFTEIKGFSTVLSDEKADKIRAAIKNHYIKKDLDEKAAIEAAHRAENLEKFLAEEKKAEFDGLNVARMVGTYFNRETRRYHLIELSLTPEQLAEFELGESFGTIYNLNHEFNVSIGKRGILKPSKLEDKKWRDYENK